MLAFSSSVLGELANTRREQEGFYFSLNHTVNLHSPENRPCNSQQAQVGLGAGVGGKKRSRGMVVRWGVEVCVCDDMVSKQCIQNLFVTLQLYFSSSVGVCTAKNNFVALLQDH